MYLKIGKKKIEIKEVTTFFERLKGFMFVLDPIKTGLCYPKCRSIHTYMMCQPIDIVMTDKNFQILYLYPKLKSEKIIFPKRHVYYTFELPVGCCEALKIGETLNIIQTKKRRKSI